MPSTSATAQDEQTATTDAVQFDWMAKEAFRTAITMWPRLTRSWFVLVGPHRTSRISLPYTGRRDADIVVHVSAADLEACDGRLEALRALARRLGRHYVYDLGLADGA